MHRLPPGSVRVTTSPAILAVDQIGVDVLERIANGRNVASASFWYVDSSMRTLDSRDFASGIGTDAGGLLRRISRIARIARVAPAVS